MRQKGSAEDNEEKPVGQGILAILQSTLAAAFGVQSEEKRQQDFTHGKPWTYILSGIVFTAVFVVVLLLIVQWVV